MLVKTLGIAIRVSGTGGRIGGMVPLLTLLAVGCVFRGVTSRSEPPAPPRTIVSPVKAHLADGSTVVFREGARVEPTRLVGAGVLYGPALEDSTRVGEVTLREVVAVESFHTDVNEAATILASTGGVALAAFGAAAAAAAIFGSCPTFYADSAGEATLEAEAFSFAIARAFEHADIDRIRVTADAEGVVKLEVRNEALETHYLDRVVLREVRHAADEEAWFPPDGGPVTGAAVRPADRVRDRSGHDVTSLLVAADGRAYATPEERIDAAGADDLLDFVTLELRPPADADSVLLALRARNSLLSTVLLYDSMLGSRGGYALDWLGRDLEMAPLAWELGLWSMNQLGIRVRVYDDGQWRIVGRIGESGPIAWEEVALLVPVTERPVQRVRLEFVADDWRIDRVAWTAGWRRAEARPISVARAIESDGRHNPDAVRALALADDAYLVTRPGQRLILEIDAGPGPFAGGRTFFLDVEGWYSEWIRTAWIRQGIIAEPFVPGPEALATALRRWDEQRSSLEARFYSTRIPVR